MTANPKASNSMITSNQNSTWRRWSLIGALILLVAAPVLAQTGTPSPSPYLTVLDASGNPVSGACIWTYVAGTSTPAATYTDVTLVTPNTNPIKASVAGRFQAWLPPGASFKYVYESSCTAPAHGTVLITIDNIQAVPGGSAGTDIIATAGEALPANFLVYLSDGSGGKTAGQWYLADARQSYSSVTPDLGMATALIPSGSSGTIRLAGEVSGFGSGISGQYYYVGDVTPGVTVTTPPALARVAFVGKNTTTVILPAPHPYMDAWTDDFRLTLTSATPVTCASDVTAATTLFLTPFSGNRIDLPDSNGYPIRVLSGEVSVAVPASTSQMYDVFVFRNGATVTLELLAWTNDTARATAIVRTTTGRPYKSGDLTRLYLGSFRTTTVSGQTENSKAKRYLYNQYNQRECPMKAVEATASWTYASAAWRGTNGSTANALDFIIGLNEWMVEATAIGAASNAAVVAANMGTAIGLDNATPVGIWSVVSTWDNGGTPGGSMGTAHYRDYPGVGRHMLNWLEYGNTNTLTFYGSGAPPSTSGGTPAIQTGIVGTIVN